MFGSIKITISAPSIYFAVSTRVDSGFTDQLSQFTLFYKIGRSLDYLYVHSPLNAARSSSCTFDFVGLNQYLARAEAVPPFKNFHTIEMPISDRVMRDHHLSSLQDLQHYVRTVVASARAQTTDSLLVHFYLGFGGRGFFGDILRACPDLPDRMDLLDIYRQARRIEPRTSLFQSNKIKVLIHMRQGDTGIVETPWHTFIPVWIYRPSEYLQEFASYDLVSKDQIEIEHFYDFVQEFKKHFANALSLVCCSDGYQATFDHLFEQIDRFNFDEPSIRSLAKPVKHTTTGSLAGSISFPILYVELARTMRTSST